MDRFADGMVARGPTLGGDRETWTGSLHIVDLPTVTAAQEFVANEPYNRAGLFERHLVRGFKSLLGRTMWETDATSHEPLFLVIGRAQGIDALARDRASVSVYGQLLTLEGAEPDGFALALQAPSRHALETLLAAAQSVNSGDLDVQIFDWEFGGRR